MNKPLVPEDIKRLRASVYFFRAAAATLRAHVNRSTPERAARDLFERDVVTEIVLKAASNPAQIATPSWAGALAATAVEDAVMQISSVSAFAALAQKGLKLDFGSYAQIKAPGRIVDANDGGTWIAGLCHGIAGLTATPGGGLNPLLGDLKQLMAALVTAGGGRDPTIVTHPTQALTLALLAGPRFDIPVLRSTPFRPAPSSWLKRVRWPPHSRMWPSSRSALIRF